MSWNMREYIDRLEAEGELVRFTSAIDTKHEIAAVITKYGEKAVLFENIKGHDIPVVGNLFGNMRKMELAFDTDRENLLQEYLQRVTRKVGSRVVAGGPVKENVLSGADVDLSRLPIPWLNEFDGGHYIDAGIIVAKDPEFGYNLALNRLHVQGRNKSSIFLLAVHHLGAYYQRAEERGEPLEIAVVIGCDPMLYVASQVYTRIDVDEYEIAGALRGEPLELVKCDTVDLEVPANAEIVLEGRILPHQRMEEGPFGEFPGYYGPVSLQPVVEYSAITCRKNPIFQTIYLGKPPTENVYLSSVPKAAELFLLAKQCVSEVKDVYLTPGGCGVHHAVISIKKRTEGEAKLALSAVLSSRIGVKFAVVVDDDIDIRNPHDVEWAIATRSQFDLDSIVFSGAVGNLDPSLVKRGVPLTSKVGIDATIPLDKDFPKVAVVSREALRRFT